MVTKLCALGAIGLACGYGFTYLMLKRWSKENETEQEYKMTFAVRKDLTLSGNKIALLCSHAAEMVSERIRLDNPNFYAEYQTSGQPKVVLKVDNEKSLEEVAENAKKLGLMVSAAKDLSKNTILYAIGPGPTQLVNEATSHLKLY